MKYEAYDRRARASEQDSNMDMYRMNEALWRAMQEAERREHRRQKKHHAPRFYRENEA